MSDAFEEWWAEILDPDELLTHGDKVLAREAWNAALAAAERMEEPEWFAADRAAGREPPEAYYNDACLRIRRLRAGEVKDG